MTYLVNELLKNVSRLDHYLQSVVNSSGATLIPHSAVPVSPGGRKIAVQTEHRHLSL